MSARLRFAMVGAGWWAHAAHLPALAKDDSIDLVAVCDPSADRAESAAITFGSASWFEDVTNMLECSVLDCAVVATPHTTHRAVVEQLLRSRVHVLVEKPMATSADDAWALVELARASDRALSVGLTYQYAGSAPTVRDVIQNDIGELIAINAEFSSGTFGLFGGDPDAFADGTDPRVPHQATYADPALSGGGQGQTQLTHLLGNLLYNTGREATEVFAYMDHRGLDVDIVDALSFRLDGGALGVASSTGTTPPGTAVRHRIRYHGTRGMVEHDLLKAEAWVFEAGGTIRHIENADHLPAYDRGAPVRHFARLVRGEGENHAPADVAAASVALIEAAYLSAAEHRPIAVRRGPLVNTGGSHRG